MPRAGLHYPGSYAELRSWFPDDAAGLDYLDWLRWPDGVVCPHCGCMTGWRMAGAVWRCADCRRRVSSTAGTIFHDTRTPLTVWFAAAWSLTTQKNGISALGLKRVLGLGSYQTTWAMLHRFRTAMVRPGRELLSGDVEVDETFVGGVTPGKRGRGAAGKALVAIAVERRSPKGYGRTRMAVISNATAPTLRAFLLAHVERGSVVLTDGLKSYPTAVGNGYSHRPCNVAGSGHHAHVPLPGVHRVASLVKRWLLGTPGRGRGRPPAGVPQRVLLQVQPTPFTLPRLVVLPVDATRRRRAAGDLPADGGKPEAKANAAHPTARTAFPSRESRASARRASVAGGDQPGVITGRGQSDGYPLFRKHYALSGVRATHGSR